MRKSAIKLMFLLSGSLLLAGCPVPYTNKIGINEPNTSPLPHPINSQKALVYITKPMTTVDFYLIGGMASDGSPYKGTDIYVQSNFNPAQRFLSSGSLEMPSCFYAAPGEYTLIFHNKGTKPEYIKQTIELSAGRVYFYGLEYTNYSGVGGGSVKFETLNENQGKNLLDKVKNSNYFHRECLNFENLLPKDASRLYYRWTLTNRSNTHYQFSVPVSDPRNIYKPYDLPKRYLIWLPDKIMSDPKNELKNTIIFANVYNQQQTKILLKMSVTKGLTLSTEEEYGQIINDPGHSFLVNQGCHQTQKKDNVSSFLCKIEIVSGKNPPARESLTPIH